MQATVMRASPVQDRPDGRGDEGQPGGSECLNVFHQSVSTTGTHILRGEGSFDQRANVVFR